MGPDTASSPVKADPATCSQRPGVTSYHIPKAFAYADLDPYRAEPSATLRSPYDANRNVAYGGAELANSRPDGVSANP